MDALPDVEPPLHENCRCAILPMEAITPGGATKDGKNGADYWLINFGKLPDYYILFSNDGLIFVTYDHYLTFYELTLGG